MTTTNEHTDERAELIAALTNERRWHELTDEQLDRAAVLLAADAQRPTLKPLTDEQVTRVRQWLWEHRAVSFSNATVRKIFEVGHNLTGEAQPDMEASE